MATTKAHISGLTETERLTQEWEKEFGKAALITVVNQATQHLLTLDHYRSCPIECVHDKTRLALEALYGDMPTDDLIEWAARIDAEQSPEGERQVLSFDEFCEDAR